MNVILKRPRGAMQLFRLWRLYVTAFPSGERKPFGIIVKMAKEGRSDLWCLQWQGRFAGLASTVNGDDTVLLDYFAIRKDLRGRGLGTAAMAALLAQYDGRGFFLEIESTREECANLEERGRRKAFYLRSGLRELGTEADVFGVRMELLGRGCRLTFREYRNFYRNHYSEWAAEHIREI